MLFVVVLVIAIAVVLVGVFAAVLFARPPSVPTGTAPRVIGVSLARSGDGSNWILTFTSVPTGLSPYDTMLTILDTSGATSLSATPLGYLNSTASGAVYVQGQPGATVAAGDWLLISITQYPTGYGYRLFDATTTFASGILR